MLQNLNLSKLMTESGGELTLNADMRLESGSRDILSTPLEFRQFLQDIENNRIAVSQSDKKITLADNCGEPETNLDEALLSLAKALETGAAAPAHDEGSVSARHTGVNLPPQADPVAVVPEVSGTAMPLHPGPGVDPLTGPAARARQSTGETGGEGWLLAADPAVAVAVAPADPAMSLQDPAPGSVPIPETTADTASAAAKATEAVVQAPGKAPDPFFATPPAGHDSDIAAELPAATRGPRAQFDATLPYSTPVRNPSPADAGQPGREPARVTEPALSVEAAPVGQGKGGESLPGNGNNLPPAMPGAAPESRGNETETIQGAVAQAVAGAARPATAVVRDTPPMSPQPQAYSLYSGHTAGTESWRHEFAAQVRWLGENGIGKAEITLKPAELGSIEIRIMSANDQTTVNFITSTPAARDTIEQSLPRLRELLLNSGLQLSESTVSHQELPDGSGNQKHGYRQRFNQAESSLAGVMTVTESGASDQPGLLPLADGGRVDFYV